MVHQYSRVIPVDQALPDIGKRYSSPFRGHQRLTPDTNRLRWLGQLREIDAYGQRIRRHQHGVVCTGIENEDTLAWPNLGTNTLAAM